MIHARSIPKVAKEKAVIIVNNRILCIGICLMVNVSLQWLARNINGFSSWYVRHIYPIWVNTLGRLLSVFPFSVVEWLLYISILLVLFFVGNIFWRCIRKGDKFLPLIASRILSLLTAVSIILLLYTMNCGINYHRDTFVEISGLSISEYSVEDLKNVCLILTEDVNHWAKEVSRAEDGTAIVDQDVTSKSVAAMHTLGTMYEDLDGYYPDPKPVTSNLLSIIQISGVYSPFTIEANYNNEMLSYNIPFTTCHELSHLKGFMREEEANFISYLACLNSSDAEFQYSGAILGWIYATNTLYDINKAQFSEVYALLDDDVKADLSANNKFWDEYESPVSQVSDKVNDTYLKVNKQADGIKSYDRMVDLLVAYYQD